MKKGVSFTRRLLFHSRKFEVAGLHLAHKQSKLYARSLCVKQKDFSGTVRFEQLKLSVESKRMLTPSPGSFLDSSVTTRVGGGIRVQINRRHLSWKVLHRVMSTAGKPVGEDARRAPREGQNDPLGETSTHSESSLTTTNGGTLDRGVSRKAPATCCPHHLNRRPLWCLEISLDSLKESREDDRYTTTPFHHTHSLSHPSSALPLHHPHHLYRLPKTTQNRKLRYSVYQKGVGGLLYG